MNPKAYCLTRSMKSGAFISKAREVAPKYSKVTHCMASDPEYGVMLRPSVASHIRGIHSARRLPCRMSFRCTDAILARLTAAKERSSYTTNQDFLLSIVRNFLENDEAAVPLTQDDGKKEKIYSLNYGAKKGICQ